MKTTIRALVSFSIASLLGCAANGHAEPRTAAQEQARGEAACAGIPAAQRASGPFAASSTPARVERLVEQVKIGKQTYPRTTGAKVTVMAEAGITRPWLDRLAVCQAALHGLGDVTVSVDEAPTSLVVYLRSQTPEDGERVLHLVENMNLRAGEGAQSQGSDARSATAGAPTP